MRKTFTEPEEETIQFDSLIITNSLDTLDSNNSLDVENNEGIGSILNN